MNRELLSIYSLKYNPFSPQLPAEALIATPLFEHFVWRIENIAREGGFALITGDVGGGKSSCMRMLFDRLSARGELTVGELSRPQAQPGDFYRELGDIFGVALRPSNRWAGTKALRERWLNHIETARMRPVLLIDEAQRMKPQVLEELRLLQSDRFDSRHLLTVVFCGDERLLMALRTADLRPLESRIRARLIIPPATPQELAEKMRHALAAAGNPELMTGALVTTLAEHATGNWRSMMTSANELLLAAAQEQRPQLDEKLYFEVFATPPSVSKRALKGGK
jgi:general secretion pathway protein A